MKKQYESTKLIAAPRGSTELSFMPSNESVRGDTPFDVYLLPYTQNEFLNPETIPQRDESQNQILKFHHLHEVYKSAVQLPFSALVMAYSRQLPSEIIEATKSGTLIPEHLEALDGIFSEDSSVEITKGPSSSPISYSDLSTTFDLEETFFRSSPLLKKDARPDMQFSGWSFNFSDGSLLSTTFDPWFRNQFCGIHKSIYQSLGSTFPSSRNDEPLEPRMGAYIGVSGNKELLFTAYDLFSQDFELNSFEYSDTSRGQVGTARYGAVGFRKQPYLATLSEESVSKILDK